MPFPCLRNTILFNPPIIISKTMRAIHNPAAIVVMILARIVDSTSHSRFRSFTREGGSAGVMATWALSPTMISSRQQLCIKNNYSSRPSSMMHYRTNTAIRSITNDATTYDDESDNNSIKIIRSQQAKNFAMMPPLSSSSSSSDTYYADHHHLALAREAMEFLDNSPDPFHAVQSAKEALELAGFVEWSEEGSKNHEGSSTQQQQQHSLHPGGKYYFTRNKSTLVAFAIGHQYQPSNGFKIIGSHTDSPNLKIKPYSKRTSSKDGGVSGMMQLSVECYGGGLWHTWFDRDLGVSGRVFVMDGADNERSDHGGDNNSNKDDDDDDDKKNDNSALNIKSRKIRQELVKIDRAILRIPNLAIHLQTASEREAFSFNKEDHLAPIIASVVKNSLGGSGIGDDVDSKKDSGTLDSNNTKTKTNISDKNDNEWRKHQEPLLVQLLASHLGIQETSIVDFELNLFDVQRASLGGAHSEFLHSARLDNLASCFLSLKGLIDHVEQGGLEKESDISMIAMFDHEEVGSSSATGAGSPIVGEAVKRISHALGANDPILFDRAIRRSFVLSVDQAHAVHPNYASKHEKNHGPKMNGGMVIKRNSNQRYATNAVTGLIVREIARRAGLPPVQEFVVRNDCGCGSTIGPVISTNTGIRAIDMGCPQLSMHSIRETMGVKDLSHGLALFRAFFHYFPSVDESIEE